jgi:LuxR family transcriptional regulator, maltose regulon positive regulatory protein
VETSLLTTKLIVPPSRPGLVPRQRLLQQLQAGLSCNLVLVSAPAGFGKTTLLGEWTRCQQPPVPVAWVSLDEGDNDPVRFWDYFIAALEILRPGVGEKSLAWLHSPQPLPVESVLMTLINDIATVPGDFILVLDDYQFIKAPPVHAGIAFLLDHLPSRMHLVIATRADPPLPLAHFRGRGTLLEIDADDLRFTLDEAVSLLKEMKGPELSPEDVGALNARTEGWAVGLKMAALSLRRQRDVSGFIAAFTGSQRYIMDYLIEEVLRQQPGEVQDFLLQTSVLERLTAPLCDAVTGRTDSRAMLINLERANLFIVPLDESREWYRYEHLFTELLRHQLEISSGTKEVSGWHQRASRWYRDNGLPADAIQHCLTAQDWERAMDLIYEESERRKKTGEMVTLLNWLKQLPLEILRTNIPLYLNYGAALLFTFQLDAAEAVYEDLESLPQLDEHTPGVIIACRALIATFHWDIPRAMALSKKALPLLSAVDIDVSSSLSLNLGMVLWQKGLFVEAEPLIKEAYEAGLKSGNYWIAGPAIGMLGDILRVRGQPQRAFEFDRQALALTSESPAVATNHFYLATILYEWNDVEAATSHLEKAIELIRLWGVSAVQASMHWYMMLASQARGNEAGGLKAMETIDQLLTNNNTPFAQACRVGYHLNWSLARGDIAQAVAWGDRAAEFGDVLPVYLRLLMVRLLIARGQKEKVPEQLRKFYEGVKAEYLSPEWQAWLIEARIYLALSASTPDEALTSLAEALALARPQGLVRTFVDEGVLLAPLLREAISRGIEPEYAARLLNIIEAEHRRRTSGGGMPPSPPTHGLLSERELEVLRLLAGGLSDRQIAENLFISLSTAKTHVRHILDKLDVRSRTQAIARARESDLI